jgi:hypothetical protein
MLLAIARQEISKRISEANAFLTTVKLQDTAPRPATLELNIGKGLYIVLLYAVLEYTVVRVFSEAATSMTAKKVFHDHIEFSLFPLILDAQLRSVEDSSRNSKWRARSDLFKFQASNTHAVLEGGAFLSETQNIWVKTLQKMFDIFGMPEQPVSDPRHKQYIDTLVDKRNMISHGRESAAVVGQSFTINELENYQNIISIEIQHIAFCVENYLKDKKYIKTNHRINY